LRDKNYDQMCAILAPLASRILCVPVNSERTCDPQELARWCRQANPAAEVSVHRYLADAYALAKSQTDRVIVITGSLFLVGEALGRLGFSADAANVSERELVLQ
jgi:folylpolyglutamate synthase/dihydropteroate synthase